MFLVLCLPVLAGAADHRFALIIGNKDYRGAPLANSLNDARDIDDALGDLGFATVRHENITAPELAGRVEDFFTMVRRQAGEGALVLVYYAGHAIQIASRNYLVGLNNPLESAESSRGLKIEPSGGTEDYERLGLYDVQFLLSALPADGRTQTLILLDACRNNPFAHLSEERAVDIDSGLAPMRAPPGTLIAYATEPGSFASDGRGRNGVYTKHLLRHVDKMITVEELFRLVRQGVIAETQNRQVPWEHSSLFEEVFVNPPRNREVPDLVTF